MARTRTVARGAPATGPVTDGHRAIFVGLGRGSPRAAPVGTLTAPGVGEEVERWRWSDWRTWLVKVSDLDGACSFYREAGAEIRDRMHWNGGERADVFLGPVMITLFTRAIYEDTVELPGRGVPAPGAVHRRSRRGARRPRRAVGPRGRRGRVRDAPHRVRGRARRHPPRVHGAAGASGRTGGRWPGGGRPMTFHPYDRPVRAAFVGLGSHLRPQRARLPRQPRCRGRRARGSGRRAACAAPGRVARSRSLRLRHRPRRQRGRRGRGRGAAAHPAASGRCRRAARPRLARQPAEAAVQRSRRGRAHAGRGRGERPRPAGHGELPVLRTAAEARGARRVRRDRRGPRVPPEDGGDRPGRLGRAHEQLPLAAAADAARPGDPRVRRRVAQALDRTLAVRPGS